MKRELIYKDGHLYFKGSGNRAGRKKHIGPNGYPDIIHNGRRVYIHRLIWEMHHGSIPKGMEIDHINRDKTDNRIENLRCVTHQENQKNVIGKRGWVYMDRYSNPYRVTVDGDLIGRYPTALDARAAYLRAKRERGII